eukprot:TRINITY_DN32674_c0_g1_i1.p1 TRINITY_DN32674_c0_g1~~TRINITY_DN32674_c0_g1_i1.p1  ORF type:complete len:378 (+),score=102.98 TRINITY_DN32674_c0_g1_i1:55-1188(+)
MPWWLPLCCGTALRVAAYAHGLWGIPTSYITRVAVASEMTDWHANYDAALRLSAPPVGAVSFALIDSAFSLLGTAGVFAALLLVDIAGAAALASCAKRPAVLWWWCFSAPHVLAIAGLSASGVVPSLVVIAVAALGRRPVLAAALLGAAVPQQPLLCCLVPACAARAARGSKAAAVVAVAAAAVTCVCVLELAAAAGITTLPTNGVADLCRCTKPNWGLHWYLQLEMFPEFRALFCSLFHVVPLFLAVPLLLKLCREPAFPDPEVVGAVAAAAAAVILSPHQTMVDVASTATMAMAVCPGAAVRYTRAMAFAFAITTSLGSVFLVAWMVHQSANANFFYFVTLAWNLTCIAATIQFVTGALRSHRAAEQMKKKLKTS